jgi:hypothetical protein
VNHIAHLLQGGLFMPLRILSFVFSAYVSVYCVFLFLTCRTRILAGGIPESSNAMLAYAASASIVLALYAFMLWRTKVLDLQTIALALLALIPALWIWFGEIYLGKPETQYWIYFDILVLLALVVLVSFCATGEISERFWLCLYFCKGMYFFNIAHLVSLPFAPFTIESVAGAIVYYALFPLLYLFYLIYKAGQFLALGYIWLWKEKKLKRLEGGG